MYFSFQWNFFFILNEKIMFLRKLLLIKNVWTSPDLLVRIFPLCSANSRSSCSNMTDKLHSFGSALRLMKLWLRILHFSFLKIQILQFSHLFASSLRFPYVCVILNVHPSRGFPSDPIVLALALSGCINLPMIASSSQSLSLSAPCSTAIGR